MSLFWVNDITVIMYCICIVHNYSTLNSNILTVIKWVFFAQYFKLMVICQRFHLYDAILGGNMHNY